jgi:hypothetical protein
MEEELTTDRARRPPRLAELPVDRSPLRHGRPAEKLSPPPEAAGKAPATRMRAPQSDPKGRGLAHLETARPVSQALGAWERERAGSAARATRAREREAGAAPQQSRRGGGLPVFGTVVVGFTRPQPKARREEGAGNKKEQGKRSVFFIVRWPLFP